MIQIRKMSKEDIVFAVQLTDTMNWNLIDNDFKFIMELEPEGCFVALDNSKKIGLVTSVSYGKVGWLGNLIVNKKYRKKGIGSLLVNHSINYLRNRNVETIGLYSKIKSIFFYRRLDFVDDSEFLIIKGNGFSTLKRESIRETSQGDIKKITHLDCLCLGVPRLKLLNSLLAQPGIRSYVSLENERVLGFIITRVYEESAEIGPLVCLPCRIDMAMDLLLATVNELKGLKISICIPQKESEIIKKLFNLGFKEVFRVLRMFNGPPIINNCVFFPESLERG